MHSKIVYRREVPGMAVAIIGGIIVAALIAGSVFLCYSANLTVPSKSLTRRWRAETAAPRRYRR